MEMSFTLWSSCVLKKKTFFQNFRNDLLESSSAESDNKMVKESQVRMRMRGWEEEEEAKASITEKDPKKGGPPFGGAHWI